MEVVNWAGQHWMDLLQSVGIVAGLLFTAYTIRRDGQARKIANLIAITQHHRRIWSEFTERREFARILAHDVDLNSHPISDEEQHFINAVILHVDMVWRAMNEDMFFAWEGVRQDIREFFSLPIPLTVWERVKRLQDAEFVHFIETCRLEK